MRTKLFLIFCPALVLLSTGCGWVGGSSGGGVAVVDLDEVAKQIGASEEMSQALAARENDLNGQLQSLKANYVQQLESKKFEFGEERTEEQTTQLVAMGQQVKLNLAQAQRNAQGNLSAHRAQLIAKFREQVIPHAEKIAKQRGLSIVVPKNDGLLLAVDESVNITSEVATALKGTWQPITVAPPKVAAGQGQTQPQPPGPPVQQATHTDPLPPPRR